MNEEPIFITQPTMPPIEEFISYLELIWENKWLTNAGPFHQQFEHALCEYLGVEHISLFTNGTSALIAALQELQLSGEVITTPFTFVATSHSLLWNGIKPVFVDIDPETCNLDPDQIEDSITEQTSAILPVHCFGHPCDVDRIQEIAAKHGLRVIYDAAHAFGVNYKGSSLLKHGNLSVLSFHATKVFNTFEGGAIVSPDAKTKQHIDYMKNFGIVDETTVIGFGCNGKMNEVSAAFGLLQLKHVDNVIARRKELNSLYLEKLNNIKGIKCVQNKEADMSNYSYFPILVESEYPISRDELYNKLKFNNINPRRYFYPLISELPIYQAQQNTNTASLSNAMMVSQKVLSLPIYPDLPEAIIDKIVDIIAD